MSIKVTLSKTFENESEFQHFKRLYDSNTSAFENVWHLEAGELEAAMINEIEKKVSCLKLFEQKVVELSEKLGVTIEEAWNHVHKDMTEALDDVEGVEETPEAAPEAPEAPPATETPAETEAAPVEPEAAPAEGETKAA